MSMPTSISTARSHGMASAETRLGAVMPSTAAAAATSPACCTAAAAPALGFDLRLPLALPLSCVEESVQED